MTTRELGESEAADDLVRAVRRLMRAAATTSQEDDDLRRVCQQVDELSERFEAKAHGAVRRIPFNPATLEEIRSGRPWRMFPFNPLGIPQSIMIEDGVARSSWPLDALHEGPPGELHGGFSAAVLDALLGVVVMAEVVPAYSVQLDVSFLHTVPVGSTVEAAAWVTDVGARRILATGNISHRGRVAVEARGVFVPIPTDKTRL